MAHLMPVKETSYLTAQNAERYRCIMRVFYQEYQRIHFQLYKEEVMELLLRDFPEDFQDYSMDQLKLDLQALVEWRNLTPFQDPRRVYTIADYKNKQFRYSMSEASVEIERMAVKLETLFMEPANLSTNYFVRMDQALAQMPGLDQKSNKQISEWWNSLQEDFKCVNQNYQDYLREFYSGRSDKILKSLEFVVHKDRFISYLEEFIRELQLHSERIAGRIRKLEPQLVTRILNRAVAAELDIPRPLSEQADHLEPVIRDNIYGKWQALVRWFVPTDGYPSESSRVLDITNEIIQKIIQNAALIVQLQNWGISRKSDYIHYIDMFLDCDSVKDAHRLAAHVFGIQHMRHFKVNADRQTDSIASSTAEEIPVDFALTPRIRTYKPRVEKNGYTSKALEKAHRRTEYLRQIEKDRQMVNRYIKGSRLCVSEIKDTVPESVRTTLLRWISLANMTQSGTGITEYGRSFTLKRGADYCTLHCEDGDLKLPEYIFEFSDQKE